MTCLEKTMSDLRPTSVHLHQAIAMGDRETVTRLLQQGANADSVFRVEGEIFDQRKSLHSTINVEMQSRARLYSSMEELSRNNNRKSLADCIDERLHDNNEILVERQDSVEEDESILLVEDKPMKLIPRLKKKISFKKARKAAKSEPDDDLVLFKARNVDDEQLNENYEGVAFFDAVREGMEMIVQVLLETSDNHQLDLPDENGFTPVMQATWHGQNECLQILLDHGADTSKQNATGCTAVHFAAGQGHLKCLETLIKYDAECVNNRTKYGATPLILASKDGHTETAEMLLSNHADPNIQYRGEQNALLFAAGNGHYDIIRLLIRKDVDLDQTNSQRVSPLMRAVQQGHNDCVTLLVESGAGLDLQDAIGRSAVHFAVENNNLKALKILLKNQAAHDLKTKGGSTPLTYAERFTCKQCEDALISHSHQLKDKALAMKDMKMSKRKDEQTTCLKLSQIFRRSKRLK